MEDEEVINLPDCGISGFESEMIERHGSVCDQSDTLSPIRKPGLVEDTANNETLEIKGEVESEGAQVLQAMDNGIDLGISNTTFQATVELTEAFEVTRKVASTGSEMCIGDGFVAIGDEGQNPVRRPETVPSVLCGVKRPRATLDEEQPSVHVVYNALTRESKQKLEDLLQQWSQWHAVHCSSSMDSTKGLECGKETYFPALLVGSEKRCAVPFWMDDLQRNKLSKEYTSLDNSSIPLYDRTYTFALTSSDSPNKLEGGLGVDASRCFNCGSYGHSLKECSKPRDVAAVNNARKQHNARRNQNASSRNPTRYYQSSPKGKYDGLRPGVLDFETRRLLGLKELDPPPWLNRMREMGYPPGYLDADGEDMPSGITIFADEELVVEETEEGEIPDMTHPDPPTKKMSVEFPGVNAPIPKDADNWLWAATSGGSSSSFKPNSRTSSYNHSSSSRHANNNHTSHISNRGHFLERQLSRDFEHERHNHRSETINRRNHGERQVLPAGLEDDGPPGCGLDPVMSPSLSKRHGDWDSHFSAPSPRDGGSGGPSDHRGSTYDRFSSRHQR
ncbi:unnamed protein product [Cuscuta epithymum]|uniref:CCHC-type domain-containing protein n=1 Tax=Cuscuta epithymum TaxID=186058 RepID=A0AAV0DJ17_9ASTE|nr:unnamed protein product [Cuscuta epithymum]